MVQRELESGPGQLTRMRHSLSRCREEEIRVF